MHIYGSTTLLVMCAYCILCIFFNPPHNAYIHMHTSHSLCRTYYFYVYTYCNILTYDTCTQHADSTVHRQGVSLSLVSLDSLSIRLSPSLSTSLSLSRCLCRYPCPFLFFTVCDICTCDMQCKESTVHTLKPMGNMMYVFDLALTCAAKT